MEDWRPEPTSGVAAIALPRVAAFSAGGGARAFGQPADGPGAGTAGTGADHVVMDGSPYARLMDPMNRRVASLSLVSVFQPVAHVRFDNALSNDIKAWELGRNTPIKTLWMRSLLVD
jgi:hypothetical protein